MKLFLLFFLSMLASGSIAQETCKPGKPVKTPSGGLIITHCVDSNKYPIRKFVTIEGIKILEGSYLSEQDFDNNRSHWVFRGDSLQETGCSDRLYLIDLSMRPVKVIAFGVKKACNEFHWASWGEKRSVIALKNDVKFIYENGKMTVPAGGEKLWKAIEPPHAGAGLELEDAVAFAEDVPPPK
jgi:hypothetical protein